MRYLLFLFLAASISCKKQTYHPSTIPDGIYKGTFQRKGIQDGLIANVTLTFSNDKWSGESEYPKYPALCNGPFSINEKGSINFKNNCAWTAEFDWTLILSGEYTFSLQGNELTISRDYPNFSADVYKLAKQ